MNINNIMVRVTDNLDNEKFKKYRNLVEESESFQEFIKTKNSVSTINRYRHVMTVYCYFKKKDLEQIIKDEDVDIEGFAKFLNENGYSANSIFNGRSNARTFFSFFGLVKTRGKGKTDHKIFEWRKKVENSKIFKEFKEDKNAAENTIKSYIDSLTWYCYFCKMTPDQLIDEAKQEQKDKIELSERKLRSKIIKFKPFLSKQEFTRYTIKTRIKNVKAFYSFFGVTIPDIPIQPLKHEDELTFNDLPTIDHIRQAIESTANPKHRLMIMISCSMGLGSAEIRLITRRDYFLATKEFHKKSNLDEALVAMDGRKDIFPLFKLRRKKTGMTFFSCCTPETNQFFIEYLKTTDNSNLDEPIIKLSDNGFNNVYKKINDKFNWGMTGKSRFFASHKLRKFHSSTIDDERLANHLQGRKTDPITDTYYKQNPEKAREKYKKHVNQLTVYGEIEAIILVDENYKNMKMEMAEKDKEIKELREELKIRDEEEKNWRNEVEKKIQNLQPLEHLDNTNPAMVKVDSIKYGSVYIQLENYISQCYDKTDGLTALDKKIQSFTAKEVEAIKEIAYDVAVKEERFKNTKECKPIVQKALAKIAINPQLLQDTVKYFEERSLNVEKLMKYHKLLYYELSNLGIYEEDELDDICDKVSWKFNLNVDKILMDDIKRELVLEDIEKYL